MINIKSKDTKNFLRDLWKKHWVVIVDIILIILLLIVPVLLGMLNVWYFAYISANQMLGYIATIISSMCTLTLGMYTYRVSLEERTNRKYIEGKTCLYPKENEQIDISQRDGVYKLSFKASFIQRDNIIINNYKMKIELDEKVYRFRNNENYHSFVTPIDERTYWIHLFIPMDIKQGTEIFNKEEITITCEIELMTEHSKAITINVLSFVLQLDDSGRKVVNSPLIYMSQLLV